MKIARVTGTVTATVKEPGLAGTKLLVVDVEDGGSNVLQRSLVAADAAGAGVGDMVLLTTGSAARLSAGTGTLPVDAAIIAVIDHVELAARPPAKTSSRKRKT
ncbi:MAG: EutN/CcmL family microcompartment protein [Geminicoccaceae bacterium]